MAETKTKPSGESVTEYIMQIEDEQKRRDSQALIRLMTKVTGKKPKMWATMIGFGEYHYTYASGHEGDTALAAFAPRKAEFSIYLGGGLFPETQAKHEALLQKLGKHRMGKGCLYVKRLSDIDMNVLEDLVRLGVEGVKAHYPTK
jgi:hypothetical protein